MNKKKVLITISSLLVIWIIVILFFSFQDPTDSYRQSGELLKKIKTFDDILEDKNIIPYIYFKKFIKYGIFNGRFTTSAILIRKFAHLVIYSILASICTLAGYSYFKKISYAAATGMTVSIGIGILDEFIQSMVNRGSSFDDVWINSIGASFGTLIVLTAIWYKNHKKKNRV